MEVQDKATTFRIVDPAVIPIKPTSPDRVKIILLGIVAGLAAGFGAIVARDSLDRSVKSVDTVRALGIPVLAVIPRITDPAEIIGSRKRDHRLYAVAGVYFSVILLCLLSEVLDYSLPELCLAKIRELM